MREIFKLKVLKIIFVLFLVQICFVVASANSYVENDQKRINVKVVFPEVEDDLLNFALDDLSRCLKMIPNYQVDLVGQKEQIDSQYIIRVGTNYLNEYKHKEIGLEGFIIDTKNKILTITAKSNQGLVNGIYTLLKDYYGIRWFAPGDIYEVVPKKTSMNFPEVNMSQSPSFMIRNFGLSVDKETSAWAIRNALTNKSIIDIGMGHAIGDIIKPSVYGDKHPEYFAMVDGKRLVPDKDAVENPQPCFSNKDVIKITVAAAKKYFEKNPDSLFFNVGINDSGLFCKCPDCKKLDAPYRKNVGGGEVCSDSYYHFFNEVAREIKKTYPGKFVSSLAYWPTEIPPLKIKDFEDNTYITLTQESAQYFDSEYKKNDLNAWSAWASRVKNLQRWDYYGLRWITPRYFPHLAAENLKFINKNNAKGFHATGHPNWSILGPQMYMAAGLLWDAKLDGDSLINEYINCLYGNASKEMAKFYDILEKYWMRSREGKWFFGLCNIKQEIEILDPNLIRDAWQELENAESKTDGIFKERVDDVKRHFEYTYRFSEATNAAEKVRNGLANSENDIVEIKYQIGILLENAKLFHEIYEKYWKTDARYMSRHFTDHHFHNLIKSWHKYLNRCLKEAIIKID